MEPEKERVMRKISINPEHILKGGLCGTCRNASTCMYLRSASKPILQCEEYEEFPPQPGNKPMEATMSMNKNNSANNPQEKSKYFGLCANCKHRETCTFPKPAGGVWHCEEYE
jgi:hypothetical protein